MGSVYLILAMVVCSTAAQRSPYAMRPYGYPEITTSTTASTPAAVLNAQDLGNRFSNSRSASAPLGASAQARSTTPGPTTTLVPLPLEANGDRAFVEKLLKLPLNDQPFWLLNWKSLEQQRRNPKFYESAPNSFLESSSRNI